MNKKIKVLSLFSGGLDSQLAIKVLQKAGFDVTAITFTTPFFGADKAEKAAKHLGVKLIVKDITKEHLKMMKAPAHGFGKNMNPCIDCHGLMLKIAKKEMKKSKTSFITTGEVLGQRPMSQNAQALNTVEKVAGLDGLLVRPLSGKLLPITMAEEKGFINRKDFLDIEGRSRKRQMELAKKFSIKNYPSPAGGCMLTDPGFSARLKKLFDLGIKYDKNDIELLKYGRHYYFETNRIIIGRNKEDNENMEALAKRKDLMIELKSLPGPVGLLRGRVDKDLIEQSQDLIIKHSTKARKLDKKIIEFKQWQKNT